MGYVLGAILALAIFIMGFIGGVWFVLRKVKSIQVTVPENADEEEMERIAQELVDRLNKKNKRDE